MLIVSLIKCIIIIIIIIISRAWADGLKERVRQLEKVRQARGFKQSTPSMPTKKKIVLGLFWEWPKHSTCGLIP